MAFQKLEGSGVLVFYRMELTGLAFHPINTTLCDLPEALRFWGPVFYRMELAGLAFHPIKHNILSPPGGPKKRQGSGDPVFCRMELAGLAFHPIKHNTLWPPRGFKVLGTLCFIERNWPALRSIP